MSLEQEAAHALRLNHILLLSHVLLILERASTLEDAKAEIKRLLEFYAAP